MTPSLKSQVARIMGEKPKKRILFSWSGGGLPGLDIHIGIWRALSELGIESDANAGTSAGAIVAALNSAGWTAADAEHLLRSLSDRDVIRHRLLWKLRMFWIGPGILNPDPILKLLNTTLVAGFEHLEKPLSVFVTDEIHNTPVQLSTGNLPTAVLASMSIAGFWPPVKLNGTLYSDGGTTENLPLPDDWTDYDHLFLLIARPPINYRDNKTPIGRALTRLVRNIHLLSEDQILDTIRFAKSVNRPHVHVIRPAVSANTGMLHFDHSLIDRAALLVKTSANFPDALKGVPA